MRLEASAPWLVLVVGSLLAGCGARPVARHEGHIVPPPAPAVSSIPQPIRTVPMPPPPEAREDEVRYSVVVANQPVRDVLLAMARETRVNFDIHPGIEGRINLNAIDQTLKQILTRIARQVDVRWESDGQTITVMPDTPYLRTYKIDYVNMSRDVTGTIGVQSQVVAPPSATGVSAGSAGQNTSLLKVDATARNRFWETLEKNLKDLLRETDKQFPEGSSETVVSGRRQATGEAAGAPRLGATGATGNVVASPGTSGYGTPAAPADTTASGEIAERRLTFREAASVIVNSETGIVSVRATSRQHEKVAEFVASVLGAARRQVLIEATVVEVVLNDNYQTGVDWSALGLNGLGYSFTQSMIGANLGSAPFFAIEYSNPNGPGGRNLSSTVKLLDSFGNTRVLSSPKIMAVNNQTAVLKVVDNRVYFTVQAQVTPGNNNQAPIVAYTTTQNVVPVGFVMNVTPQIADNDVVVLNVRPTVSRILGFVKDPNPDLARVGVINNVPEIQSREFESVLRVPSGQIAILGGLMHDSFEGKRDGVPLLSRLPFVGDAVSYRNDTSRKSELVIFLRPIVVRDASLEGDLAHYRRYLPGNEFFHDTHPIGSAEFEEGVRKMEQGQFPPGKPNPVVPDPPPPGGRP
jgi:general secretion pathway protein D